MRRLDIVGARHKWATSGSGLGPGADFPGSLRCGVVRRRGAVPDSANCRAWRDYTHRSPRMNDPLFVAPRVWSDLVR